MAERQIGREHTPGKDPSAQDGAAPLRDTPPITQPRLTLPSLPGAGRPSRGLLPPRPPSSAFSGQGLLHRTNEAQQPPAPAGAAFRSPPAAEDAQQAPPRPPLMNRPSASGARSGPLQAGRQPTMPPRRREPTQPAPSRKGVTLISTGQREQGRARRVGWTWRSVPGRVRAAIILCALVALALAIIFGGVLKGGVEPQAVNYTTAPGGNTALQTPTVVTTLPPGLDTTDTGYYIAKYGFDAPKTVRSIPSDEQQRLAQMMPYALKAAARYDARYQAQVEPEMLLWWTHSEAIGAHINYSDCANEAPPAGQTYFSAIMNCDRPDFWQLGYGNQFGNIWVLKDAFTDMDGNPNDPALVQKVGQAVLDYDTSQHTIPACGGYSCTFPAMTIDQIMADVHWHASDHKETVSNWWASVLSRDPGINAYMLAVGLNGFSHQETKNWVGCYYQEPCWQTESDALWDVLAIWKSLGA